MLCTIWRVKRVEYLNILEIQGKAICEKGAEKVLLSKAVDIIEKAKECKGIPVEPNKIPYTRKETVLVTFALLFPSKNEIQEFIRKIPNE